MSTVNSFEITTPGILVAQLIPVDLLAEGDTLDTIVGSTSIAGLSIYNEMANDMPKLGREVGRVIQFDLAASANIAPDYYPLYFTYTTVNGESLILEATLQVKTHIVVT